jgi:glycosyltransferase involved in cell wall biosynthesis
MGRRVLMLLDNHFTHDARVLREAKTLRKEDYEVTVIAHASPDLPDEEVIEGVRVRRFFPTQHSQAAPPGVRLLRHLASLSRNGGYRPAEIAALSMPFDVVHAHDLRTLPLGVRLSAARGRPLVYDCHDLRVERCRGAVRPMGIRERVRHALELRTWSRIEHRDIHRPDASITVSDSMADYLAQKHGIERPLVVRNCPEVSTIPVKGSLRRELAASGACRVLLYQGGVNRMRALREVIAAMDLLPQDCLLALRVLGDPDVVSWLKQLAARGRCAERIRFLRPVAPNEVAKAAIGADAGFALFEDLNVNQHFACPNKMFEYMAAGVPVVGSDLPEIRRIVQSERIGILVDKPHATAIADAVLQLLCSSDHAQMKERARQAACERHNWRVESRELVTVYERLLGGVSGKEVER